MTIWGLDGKGSVDGIGQFMDESLFVIIFVAVGLVSGNFPSDRIRVDLEFGQLLFNTDLLEFGLRLNFVTKSHSVVKNTEANSENAARVDVFGKVED